MKNLCILKITISIFRRIIVGKYYVGRGTQSQLKFNETLVRFENVRSIFRRIIVGLYYVGRGTEIQPKYNEKLVCFKNGNFSFSMDYHWLILRRPWNTNPTKMQ